MSVRFTVDEEKWLKEGHRLFFDRRADASMANNWFRKTLERFPFHPSRTHASLKQKWHVMHK